MMAFVPETLVSLASVASSALIAVADVAAAFVPETLVSLASSALIAVAAVAASPLSSFPPSIFIGTPWI